MKISILFFFFSLSIAAQNNLPTIEFSTYQAANENSISMEECIELIKKEEQKYPENEQINTKLMITRLRKIFYDFPSWDKYLIKGTEEIKSPYPTNRINNMAASDRTIRTRIGLKIKLIDRTSTPLDSNNHISDFRKNSFHTQEVHLKTFGLVDIAHTLCGLDAYNHPSPVEPPRLCGIKISRLKIDDNMDAITWLGDLGSLLSEMMIEKRVNHKISKEKQQKLVNTYFPAADILGNNDAYSIAKHFEINSTNGKKISEIFNTYFLSQNANYQQFRCQYFLEKLGFVNGISAQQKAKLIKFYSKELSAAAVFYFTNNAKNFGYGNILKASFFIHKIKKSADAKILFTQFLKSLEQKVNENKI